MHVHICRGVIEQGHLAQNGNRMRARVAQAAQLISEIIVPAILTSPRSICFVTTLTGVNAVAANALPEGHDMT